MNEAQLKELSNEIGNLSMRTDDSNADNLGIGMILYFEAEPDLPEGDVDDEVGWSRWAIAKTDDLLRRIVKTVEGRIKNELSADN